MPEPARKCLLILLDGLADRAHPGLGGRTPLQAARTPNLDRLADGGACGYFHALRPGAALSSEAAHFFMMGYSPAEFPGRGYLEALGHGLANGPDQVWLLAHLACFEKRGDSLRLIQRRPPMTNREAEPFFHALAGFSCAWGRVDMHQTKGSSGAAALIGGQLSRCITDSDPLWVGRSLMAPLPWAGHEESPTAQHSVKLLTAFLRHAHQVLAGLPANQQRDERGFPVINGVITQRAGQAQDLPTLRQRWGLRVLSLSSAPIYLGVFKALGAKARLVPEGPDPCADLAAKLELAAERLAGCDLIHVHSKAPDEAAHTKDPAAKVSCIEELDQGLERLVAMREEDPDLLVVVTGDHATPSSGEMVHSGENSPLLMAGPGVWRDQVAIFDEVNCARGALGLLCGDEMMKTILSHLDRAKLWGMRDHPQDLPYYPGPRTALVFSEDE